MSLSAFNVSSSAGNVSAIGNITSFSSLNSSLDEVLEDNVIRSVNFPLFEIDDPYEYRDRPCHPLNEFFNCTPEDYLSFARGPQRLPMNITILVSQFSFYTMQIIRDL